MIPAGQIQHFINKFKTEGTDEKLDIIRIFDENNHQKEVLDGIMEILALSNDEWEKEALAPILLNNEKGMDIIIDGCKNSPKIQSIYSSEPFPGLLASTLYTRSEAGDFKTGEKIVQIMVLSNPEKHIHSLLGALTLENEDIANQAYLGISQFDPDDFFEALVEYLEKASEINGEKYLKLLENKQNEKYILPLAHIASKNKYQEPIVSMLGKYDRQVLDKSLPLDEPLLDEIRKTLKLIAPDERFEGPMPRVLIVEDTQSYTTLLKAMLIKSGFIDFACAEDGNEGVKVARKYKPHIVLMDIGMPSVGGFDDGIEAAEVIIQENQDIFLMFVTNKTQEDIIKRAELAGAHDFTSKIMSYAQFKEKMLNARAKILDSGFLF